MSGLRVRRPFDRPEFFPTLTPSVYYSLCVPHRQWTSDPGFVVLVTCDDQPKLKAVVVRQGASHSQAVKFSVESPWRKCLDDRQVRHA
jgi:hypothetical protein